MNSVSLKLQYFLWELQKKLEFLNHGYQNCSSILFELKGSWEKNFRYTIPESYGFQTLPIRPMSLEGKTTSICQKAWGKVFCFK